MQFADILSLAGLRADGREPGQMRQLRCKIGGHVGADGSAYLEQGLNKVLVLVHGPAEASSSSSGGAKRGEDGEEKARLVCQVVTAPFAGADWKRTVRKGGTSDRRSMEIEEAVQSALSSVVVLDQACYGGRSQLTVVVHILEQDGSILSTVINGAVLALVDAGVYMTDLVAAVTIGMVKDSLCVDLNQMEQGSSAFVLPIAVKASNSEIVYIKLESRMSISNLEAALNFATSTGAAQVIGFMKTSIREAMDPNYITTSTSANTSTIAGRSSKQGGGNSDDMEI